jgi:hypothetical protein
MKSRSLHAGGLLLCFCGVVWSQQPKPNVQPIDVLRIWQSQNQNAKIVETGPKLVWLDMEQPEVLYIVGSAMEKVNRKAEAAMYLTLYLRTLDLLKAPWSDVKVDQSKRPALPKQLTIELIVPEGQKWSEGVWIDYLDFFEN